MAGRIDKEERESSVEIGREGGREGQQAPQRTVAPSATLRVKVALLDWIKSCMVAKEGRKTGLWMLKA
jgi:hypothetical protein